MHGEVVPDSANQYRYPHLICLRTNFRNNYAIFCCSSSINIHYKLYWYAKNVQKMLNLTYIFILFLGLYALILFFLSCLLYIAGCFYLRNEYILTLVTSNVNYRECSLNKICRWKRGLMFTPNCVNFLEVDKLTEMWTKCIN